jgi:uncharacterized protein (UPF0335 family)
MRETLRRLERLEKEIDTLKGRVREAISHTKDVIAQDPQQTERAVQRVVRRRRRVRRR